MDAGGAAASGDGLGDSCRCAGYGGDAALHGAGCQQEHGPDGHFESGAVYSGVVDRSSFWRGTSGTGDLLECFAVSAGAGNIVWGDAEIERGYELYFEAVD